MKAKALLYEVAVKSESRLYQTNVAVSSNTLPIGVCATASLTENVYKQNYLYVTPETTQSLVWVVPQVGVEFDVWSNTDWFVD